MRGRSIPVASRVAQVSREREPYRSGVKWNKAGWVTNQFMVHWLLEVKLPQEVYAAPACVPVVERSADLMIFLVREKSLTQDHLVSGVIYSFCGPLLPAECPIY